MGFLKKMYSLPLSHVEDIDFFFELIPSECDFDLHNKIDFVNPLYL